MTAFNVNILEPFTFAGILFGAMLPYAFTALTMKAVGDAAQNMIGNITQQINHMKSVTDKDDKGRDIFNPNYMDGFGKAQAYAHVKERTNNAYPNTNECVSISTEQSL